MISKLLGLGIIGVAMAVTPAMAQTDYPTRPIRLVVGFSPGGPTDIVARLLAQKMGEKLGQNLIVENRPGANSNIAANEVAHARPDGYTLLYNTSSIAISPALYKDLKYDVRKALVPVGLSANVPIVLEVNPKLPVKDIKEFEAYLKKQGGKVSYSSTGNGSITQLAAALVLNKLKVEALHVPYPGSAPALIDLSGGVVDFMADTVNSSLPFIKDNRLRAIAVTSKQRLAILPDVPTLGELGLQDVEIGAWQGIMAPTGTPQPIIDKLNAVLQDALKDPGVLNALAQQATDPLGGTPAEYGKFLESEIGRFQELVSANKIQMN
ncbi:Bug family tripartite tricarboxylate transporter substrate binding protein [Xanthobacteraceae bacterium A53D]